MITTKTIRVVTCDLCGDEYADENKGAKLAMLGPGGIGGASPAWQDLCRDCAQAVRDLLQDLSSRRES